MPCLKNCCFCCQLPTGGVILGWVNTISSFLYFVWCAVVLARLDAVVREAKRNDMQFENIRIGVQVIFAIGITMSIINIVAGILLIVGSMKKNRFMLLPWLYSMGTSLIIVGIMLFLYFIGLCAYFSGIGFLVFIIFSAVFGLFVYFWICVLSLFQLIRETEEMGARGQVLLPHQQQLYPMQQQYPNQQYPTQPYPNQQYPTQQQQQQQTMIKNDLPAYSSIA